ncbi:unnamed protein product [Schistocephalus solidus]|uniref:C2H2-type domain-containing protein n=1 Tax=Schistocephalus solidus TaxID=70667 RepID=A0A183SW00_SCHSO|nr:unnamed protein product [Schistocephalus solidus]
MNTTNSATEPVSATAAVPFEEYNSALAYGSILPPACQIHVHHFHHCSCVQKHPEKFQSDLATLFAGLRKRSNTATADATVVATTNKNENTAFRITTQPEDAYALTYNVKHLTRSQKLLSPVSSIPKPSRAPVPPTLTLKHSAIFSAPTQGRMATIRHPSIVSLTLPNVITDEPMCHAPIQLPPGLLPPMNIVTPCHPSPLLLLLFPLLSPFFPPFSLSPLLYSFFFPSSSLLTLPPSPTVENVLRIPDTEVLERTGILSIHAMLNPGHGSPGADRNPQHPCHAEASVTAMERTPDVAMGVCRQRGQKRRYKVTLKKSLKQLQINLEDLAQDKPAWRKSVKTGLAIYEANRIAAAKAKRAAQTTSIYSSPVTPTTATTPAFAFTTTTICDGESLLSCRQCDRTFTSRIGLVGHWRIHRTETGEPVPGAPTHSRDRDLHCPHCPRAFTHRMGLFGHMRIHDSGIHHNADNTDTPYTPSAPAILTSAATPYPSFLTSLSASTHGDISVKKSFVYSLVVHSQRVAAPSQLHLPQHGVDAEDSGPLQDLRVRDPVLPFQLQHFAEAAKM